MTCPSCGKPYVPCPVCRTLIHPYRNAFSLWEFSRHLDAHVLLGEARRLTITQRTYDTGSGVNDTYKVYALPVRSEAERR